MFVVITMKRDNGKAVESTVLLFTYCGWKAGEFNSTRESPVKMESVIKSVGLISTSFRYSLVFLHIPREWTELFWEWGTVGLEVWA